MTDYVALEKESKQLLGQMGKEHGSLMQGFAGLGKAVMPDHALTKKTKELICVALAVATQCDKCIAHHVHGALDNGATRAEIVEAAGVAVYMGGGPKLMYAENVLKALDDFGAE
jgi:AhpD family alkylhydroperoxidase